MTAQDRAREVCQKLKLPDADDAATYRTIVYALLAQARDTRLACVQEVSQIPIEALNYRAIYKACMGNEVQ